MQLHVRDLPSPPKAEELQHNRELSNFLRDITDSYMMLKKQLEVLFDEFIDTSNIREISANKITAGTIKALIEIISPLITGGTIVGGTIKTANKGKRVEISENQIRCYNKDNKLNGFCIDNDDSQYGDVSFYSKGVKLFTIYNNLEGISLMPVDGKPLSIGSSGSTTTFAGSSIFPSIELDSGTTSIKLYFDGTNLKGEWPDGTIKTFIAA